MRGEHKQSLQKLLFLQFLTLCFSEVGGGSSSPTPLGTVPRIEGSKCLRSIKQNLLNLIFRFSVLPA